MKNTVQGGNGSVSVEVTATQRYRLSHLSNRIALILQIKVNNLVSEEFVIGIGRNVII